MAHVYRLYLTANRRILQSMCGLGGSILYSLCSGCSDVTMGRLQRHLKGEELDCYA